MHGASDLAAASATQITLPRGKRLALLGRHPSKPSGFTTGLAWPKGVESKVERDHLRDLACDAAQGRYLAAPCAPLEARRLVMAGGIGA